MTSPTPAIAPLVVVAGATGDLGRRIAAALTARGAAVRAVVRAESSPTAKAELTALGVDVVTADLDDVASVASALRGASCVVSAVSGLRDVIVERQSVLLDASVAAGVPRFISSDYSADFTKSEPGHNRNFDLRREFAGRADRAPIAVTSILNGAFMDMLGAEMPIIQPRIRTVLYWGDADQVLDFTTRDDTAAYTAAAALDPDTPRVLRIAGAAVSAKDIAGAMTEASGTKYRTIRAGSVRGLGRLVPLARLAAPEKPDPVFPAWQGMAYSLDMFSGAVQLSPLDNDRYPEVRFTTLRERFASGHLPGATS